MQVLQRKLSWLGLKNMVATWVVVMMEVMRLIV
jgi:hypothetical protein